MITIENALNFYTNMLNKGSIIDLNYFEKNLSIDDFNEFLDLMEVINIGKSIKITDEFEKHFTKINEHKKSIESLKLAASFRNENENESDDVMDELDIIFKEEFNDE